MGGVQCVLSFCPPFVGSFLWGRLYRPMWGIGCRCVCVSMNWVEGLTCLIFGFISISLYGFTVLYLHFLLYTHLPVLTLLRNTVTLHSPTHSLITGAHLPTLTHSLIKSLPFSYSLPLRLFILSFFPPSLTHLSLIPNPYSPIYTTPILPLIHTAPSLALLPTTTTSHHHPPQPVTHPCTTKLRRTGRRYKQLSFSKNQPFLSTFFDRETLYYEMTSEFTRLLQFSSSSSSLTDMESLVARILIPQRTSCILPL